MAGLIRKSGHALREGEFFGKLWVFLTNRPKKTVQRAIKIVKNKYGKFSGNWYHGEIAKDYETIRLKQDWWHDEMRILEKFLKLIPKGVSVLDIPIGTARFLPLYHEHGMTVSGLDISHDMLFEAKELRGDLLDSCRITIGDAMNAPYTDSSFDVIVSFRFLDGHVTFGDMKKVIGEFCRVSRKYLIVELGAVPEGGGSELVLKDLAEDQPIYGRLSEEERVNFLGAFGLRLIASESALRNGEPFVTVYLCEKSSLNR